MSEFINQAPQMEGLCRVGTRKYSAVGGQDVPGYISLCYRPPLPLSSHHPSRHLR